MPCTIRSALQSPRGSHEGTVWRAVDCFGVNWDIEDSDFPAMFADAMQQAQPTLDNPALQPIGGLQNLMLRDSEVELVRECFRWLYNEDGGDISKRRGRAELFADQINGRFRRVFPAHDQVHDEHGQRGVLPEPVGAARELLVSGQRRQRRGRITFGCKRGRLWRRYGLRTCRATTRCATTCCTRWRITRRSSPRTRPYAEQELGGIDDPHCTCLCTTSCTRPHRRAVLPEGLHPRLDEQGSAQRL